MDEKLNAFIAHARGKGMDHATIRMLLLSAGWKEKEISAAMAAEGLDMPVPEPPGAGGARDAFLYLLCFSALYVLVISGITIYFQYLDTLLPDAAGRNWYSDAALEPIRWSLAAIFVSFPLFIWLSRLLEREVRHDPEKHHRPVRKWLTYLTLFVTVSAMMIDLITLLYYFLEGGLTSRFVLKALVLLVITGIVFIYYLQSIQATPREPTSAPRRALMALAVLLGAGALFQGFALAGSPQMARLRRLDERRVDELQAIHHALQKMVTTTDKDNVIKLKTPLPPSLAELAAFQGTQEYAQKLSLSDPQTGEPYAYTVTGEAGYELCATFSLVRDRKYELFWNHPAGKHCFTFGARHPP